MDNPHFIKNKESLPFSFDVIRDGRVASTEQHERRKSSDSSSSRKGTEDNNSGEIKQKMSEVFRGGYTQRIYEEKITFSVMDRVMKHPELKHEFMDMLQHGIPDTHDYFDDKDSYHLAVQTTRAFEFAKDYQIVFSQLQKSTPSLDSATIHADTARKAFYMQVKKQEGILNDPDAYIFRGTRYRDDSREESMSIDAGRAEPQEECTDEERAKIKEALSTITWEENLPEGWDASFKGSPDTQSTQFLLDFSSLSLSYQEKPLVSLEVTSSFREDTPYIAARLTTERKTYYVLDTGNVQKKRIFDAIDQVRPFLSGDQLEKVITEQRRDAKPESFWQEWHLVDTNRENYYKLIHPAVADYTQSVIEHLVSEGKQEVMILDIAGGNGDLAELIIKDTQERFPKLGVTYYMIDGNKEDTGMADERFHALRSEHVQAFALWRDMSAYEFDAKRMMQDIGLPQEGVDIIINCGGLLNESVAHDVEEAKAYYGMYLEIMEKPGAHGVFSGHTPLGIRATDHKENGMEIRNLFDEFTSLQMHVVKRPDGE